MNEKERQENLVVEKKRTEIEKNCCVHNNRFNPRKKNTIHDKENKENAD